ncbi:MAG: class I SAM-dependent methyltransferase [Anaerolineales bacterium]|nr:class I SAM-dependent methyltransferase [Anaerolineales bacterium]
MNKNFDDATGRSKFFENVDKELNKLIDPATGRVKVELLEHVNCPVCDADSYDRLFVKQGFDFVRCRNCNLVYVNPRLLESATLAYYCDAADQQSMTDWLSVLASPANQAWQVPYFQEAVDILANMIPAKSRILDIGCSIGLFMEVARKSGFECIGLEPEPKSREYAVQRGLDVRPELFKDAGFSANSFDAITMFGVMEHLSNPRKILVEVWDALKPGGVVMAVSPNVYSLANGTLHEQARTFTGRNHLSYFSRDTFSHLFERCGYEVVHLDTALTGLDAVLNHWQFNNPHSGLSLELLPPKMRQLLQNPEGRAEFEKLIRDWDMGLRLRLVARKPK